MYSWKSSLAVLFLFSFSLAYTQIYGVLAAMEVLTCYSPSLKMESDPTANPQRFLRRSRERVGPPARPAREIRRRNNWGFSL